MSKQTWEYWQKRYSKMTLVLGDIASFECAGTHLEELAIIYRVGEENEDFLDKIEACLTTKLIFDERVSRLCYINDTKNREDDDRIQSWYKYDIDDETFVEILSHQQLHKKYVYWWDGHTCGWVWTVEVDSEEEFVKLLEEASGTSL